MNNTTKYTTFLMKTGEMVKVPVEEFEDFIEQNRDRIQPQYKKMGKRRSSPVTQ